MSASAFSVQRASVKRLGSRLASDEAAKMPRSNPVAAGGGVKGARRSQASGRRLDLLA